MDQSNIEGNQSNLVSSNNQSVILDIHDNSQILIDEKHDEHKQELNKLEDTILDPEQVRKCNIHNKYQGIIV